jgi:hypothetical protein
MFWRRREKGLRRGDQPVQRADPSDAPPSRPPAITRRDSLEQWQVLLTGQTILSVALAGDEDGEVTDFLELFLADGSSVVVLDSHGYPPIIEPSITHLPRPRP